jgi:hypothetical protein
MSRIIRAPIVLFAATALVFAGCSDDDADSVTSEAEERVDEAREDADDLKEDVEEKLDEAGDEVDEGLARGQAEIFRQRLTDLGGDDEPSLSVVDLEDIASELPGDPEVTGIEDDDGDGDDDDGKIEITVDESSACVTISGSSVEVDDGAC